MTKITLLERLKDFTEEHTGDLLLPVQPQEDDENPPDRAATVYIPCLPELRSYARKAPFITHEIVTSKDAAAPLSPGGGKFMQSSAVVRSCFCVYDPDEQKGKLALLSLTERLRVALLEEVVIGNQFKLDLDAGLEALTYPGNPNQTAVSPFYLGEMITTWQLPIIERKVPNAKENNWNGGGIR